MNDKYYLDYLMMPSGFYAEGFRCSLFLLRTLERMELMEIRHSFTLGLHDVVDIIIDGKYYGEDIRNWLRRFRGRSSKI